MSILNLYYNLAPSQRERLHNQLLELGLLNSLNPAKHRLTLYKLARKTQGTTCIFYDALLRITPQAREQFYDRICGLDIPPEGNDNGNDTK